CGCGVDQGGGDCCGAKDCCDGGRCCPDGDCCVDDPCCGEGNGPPAPVGPPVSGCGGRVGELCPAPLVPAVAPPFIVHRYGGGQEDIHRAGKLIVLVRNRALGSHPLPPHGDTTYLS